MNGNGERYSWGQMGRRESFEFSGIFCTVLYAGGVSVEWFGMELDS